MTLPTHRRSHAEADRPLARRIGARLRRARSRASLTQAQLAEGRYTKAYVSALENGLVKPSMAALNFFATRLGISIEDLVSDREQTWTRLEADIQLASGDWERAIDAFSSLLDADPPDHARGELLLGLAEAFARLDRGQEAVRTASASEALLVAQSRIREAAWARYWKAYGLYALERSDQAAGLLTELLGDIGGGLAVEPDLPVRVLIALAMVATRDDEPERALAYLEQARARVGELDDRKRAVFLFSLALSYRELGDYEAAISTGTQGLALFKAADARAEAASIENELALVFLALGNLDRAKALASLAHDHFIEMDDDWRTAHVLDTEGQIALAAGQVSAAMSLASDAHRLAVKAGNRKGAISAQLLLAQAQRAGGDLSAAATMLREVADLAERCGRRGQLQAVLREWSDVTAEQGDLAKALTLSRRAIDAGRR